jgi:hypothetical protein
VSGAYSTICVCCVWLAACAGAPPFAPAPVELVVAYRVAAGAGAGSGEAVDNVPEADPKSVRVDVFALQTAPPIGSIEPHLAAVVAESGAPFRAASSLPPATRYASPAPVLAAGRDVRTGTAVVAGALVTTFTPSAPHLPAIGLERAAAGVRLSLRTQGAGARGDERALVQLPLTEAAPGLLFVPAIGVDAGDRRVAGHAIVVTVTGTAEPAAVAAARASAEAAAQRAPAPGAAAAQWRLAADAIGEQDRRAAMLAVAAQLDLPACTDVLLAADERHLITIGDQLTGLDATAADYAWAFQRAIWNGLVPGLQRDELPPGLRAAIIRRLGAVAAEPSVLQLHLASSQDAATFAAALQEENVYALQDRDPVHRVQAHDWLVAHGHAVAAYDPLAPAADRAAALRRHVRAEVAR